MTQYHFDPATYLENIRADIPVFDEFQAAVADAARSLQVRRILELGVGTGETARRLLAIYPDAELVGIDESAAMLEQAAGLGELHVSRLEDALPAGPFDLVVSALAVHHLDPGGKRDLFRRVRDVLRRGGTFVLGDVVVPERAEDAVIPLTPDFDRPDPLADVVAWLEDAGFVVETTWLWKDLAVVRATYA